MSKLLISVTSKEEAKIASQCGADIIDLKDPAKGALGALDISLVNEIVAFLNLENSACIQISATIGDLPMEPDLICERVQLMHDSRVDFIKVGFFVTTEDQSFEDQSSEDAATYIQCLTALKRLAKNGIKLVAVLFAEFNYPENLPELIEDAGFYGIMLDTANKNGISVLQYAEDAQKAVFVKKLKDYALQFGLAGSLKPSDISLLAQYSPDYIGFRSGVCSDYCRTGRLNPDLIAKVRDSVSMLL